MEYEEGLTVKDLIKKLSTMDPDTPIVKYGRTDGWDTLVWYPVRDVECEEVLFRKTDQKVCIIS